MNNNNCYPSIKVRVEACYCQIERRLKRQFCRPEIGFNLKGKCAGTAHLQQNKIRFNPVLFNESPDEFVNQIVPHEICHLIAYQIYGAVKPHGKEWQALMVDVFGLQPKVTHCINTAAVEGKTFAYQCGCGSVLLSIRRHNKIIKKQATYRCRRCKQPLTKARAF